MVLKDKNLWGWVNGAKPSPKRWEVSEQIKADGKRHSAGEYSQQMDQKAQIILVLSISDAEMIHVWDAPTAADMWKQLCLIKECRKDSAGVVQNWLNKLHPIIPSCKMGGACPVSDGEFCGIIASSLPHSWDTFITEYLDPKNSEKTSSHELITALLEEDKRRG
ncbi:hypothetical protein C8Q75DRAFT_801648 [Abortiporus biennis]|nr:hypothetical protein C8Q75DRAFT_801648 [Abortiporus biennis]